MNFITEINLKVDKKIWIDNLKRTNLSTGYQLPNWLEIYQNSFNSIPFYITIKNLNHEIVGQLACIIHQAFHWRQSKPISKFLGQKFNLSSTLYWSYGPVIHDKLNYNLILSEILIAINKIVSQNNITYVNYSSSPFDLIDYSIFENFGYSKKIWSTYVLDLINCNSDLLSTFNKKIRYDVRQAMRMNLQFEAVSNRKQFDEFAKFGVSIRNLKGDYRKWNPHFYDNYWNLMYKSGFHKAFLVRDKNEILGSIDALIFDGNLVQAGATNSLKQKFGSGTFLTFKTIEWAIEQNLKKFDFGGVNPNPINEKEKQISFYKSKWSGEKKDFYIFTKIINGSKTKLASLLKRQTMF
jgi:hypothetical protein